MQILALKMVGLERNMAVGLETGANMVVDVSGNVSVAAGTMVLGAGVSAERGVGIAIIVVVGAAAEMEICASMGTVSSVCVVVSEHSAPVGAQHVIMGVERDTSAGLGSEAERA